MNPDITDNTNRNFRGQQRLEEVICFCRKHPIILLKPFLINNLLFIASLVGIFYMISTGILVDNTPVKLLAVVIFTLMTVTHHVFFTRLFHYYLDIVIVTNYRVIDLKKSVFLQDDKEIIDLHEIQDIKKIQVGILSNLLNYGSIKIATASLSTSMTLHSIPRPEYYLNQINQTKRHYILYRRHQKVNPELTRKHAQALSRSKAR